MKINGQTKVVSEKPVAVKDKAGTQVSRDASGNVTVDLTAGKNDTVHLRQGPSGHWTLQVGKTKLQLSPKEVEGLTINTGDGKDKVFIEGDLKKPIKINTGAGDDYVKVGSEQEIQSKRTTTDRKMVDWQGPTGRHDRDTFEYFSRGGKVQAREGETLPSSTWTKSTELHAP